MEAAEALLRRAAVEYEQRDADRGAKYANRAMAAIESVVAEHRWRPGEQALVLLGALSLAARLAVGDAQNPVRRTTVRFVVDVGRPPALTQGARGLGMP